MLDTTLLLTAAVFILAGLIKGAIGLGLPTVSMGLLSLAMPPLQAAALLILPSFVTNVWQMLAGSSLAAVVRRLWPMMIAICFGTWVGIGLMTETSARLGTALLGVALALYAVSGLAHWRLSAPPKWEPVLAPVMGVLTGLVSAVTGVFVIPAVPFLQAVGFEKEQLVQALGLSFTVSTVALAVNISVEHGLRMSMAIDSLVALMAACLGMWVGQALRLRMSAAAFRRWFFEGLLGLGLYLSGRVVV
jgi:uncharacterized membrane protein YfcA